MSKWGKTQKHRRPDEKELNKIFFMHYELSELFFEEEIIDLMIVARQSVAGEFYFAKEENPRWRSGSDKKRFRGTDNFIIGIGGKPSDLARYIAERTHRQIVCRKQLPQHLKELSPKLIERIIGAVRYDIVLNAINAMIKNGEIRYDIGIGTWNINQSNIDSFLNDRAFRKVARHAIKNDYRPWHGRPGRDRGRMPEGVSVSFA